MSDLLKKDKAISGYDIVELMKDMKERANIQTDTDIKPTDDVEKIFKNRGHCIFFHKWPGQRIGHWVCIIRNKDLNQVYYYDSFASLPYNKSIIDVVLKKYPSILINDVEFQGKDRSTCGKHCLMVIALNKMGLSPHQIEEFFKSINVDEWLLNIFPDVGKS
jgi:hypothetical protein